MAGARAQYKGTGTIDGQAGALGFFLTAIDGDLSVSDSFPRDRFRIRIWKDATGLVYDNALGVDDDLATTELGGGSIVIHKR